MLDIETTSKYRRDYRLMHKRGLDLSLLCIVIQKLRNGEPLDAKHRDHPLVGNDNEAMVLTALRTGSHSDLF